MLAVTELSTAPVPPTQAKASVRPSVPSSVGQAGASVRRPRPFAAAETPAQRPSDSTTTTVHVKTTTVLPLLIASPVPSVLTEGDRGPVRGPSVLRLVAVVADGNGAATALARAAGRDVALALPVRRDLRVA